MHAPKLWPGRLKCLAVGVKTKVFTFSNILYFRAVAAMSQVNNVAAVTIKVVSDVTYLASFITSDRNA